MAASHLLWHGDQCGDRWCRCREMALPQAALAGLVAAALLGHRLAGKALGGAVGPEDPSTSRRVRRVLVGLVAALHAARAARRARRGGVVACGCAPVFVKARVKVK